MGKHATAALIVISATILTGCRSVTSTLLNRTDNDVFVGNSNGDPNRNCSAHPFNGVPITLRVPTHLDVAIKEKIFLLPCSDTTPLKRASTPHRHLYVEPTLVETDKVFTVDVKRPMAGTLDYGMTFGGKTASGDNSQYFTELTESIVDKTIQDVNTALQTVLPLLRKTTGTGTQTSGTDQPPTSSLDQLLVIETRTVAWKRFDLDDPAFEHLVGDFIERNLDCCNTCDANTSNGKFWSELHCPTPASAPPAAGAPAPTQGPAAPAAGTPTPATPAQDAPAQDTPAPEPSDTKPSKPNPATGAIPPRISATKATQPRAKRRSQATVLPTGG
jgi:hypothetical protein